MTHLENLKLGTEFEYSAVLPRMKHKRKLFDRMF